MKYAPWIFGVLSALSIIVAVIVLPVALWLKLILHFLIFFILTGITGSMQDKDRYEEVSVDDFI